MRIFPIAAITALALYPFSAFAFNPNYLLSDHEMTDRFALDLGAIQNILARGILGRYVTEDIDGRRRYAGDIIWRTAQRNGISPKVIITMLQKEQSLVEDPSPKQTQFDWAMGYGICDSCSYETPSAQRFKGFAKQVNSATLQLSDGYLADLAARGRTVLGFAPGTPKQVDGTVVIPENNATAALYTYTPHLHGNKNFVTIFDRYFSKRYPTGTLLRDPQTGGVYLIQYGKKRPFLSLTALTSRYDVTRVIEANPTDLDGYEAGLPIAFANYALLSAGETVYLLVDDVLRPFASSDVLRGLGFNSDEVLDVKAEEIAFYDKGLPITLETTYVEGVVFKHDASGTFYFIQDGKRHLIATDEIRLMVYGARSVRTVSEDQIVKYKEGQAVKFPDGVLVKTAGEAQVYVISEGTRRLIPDEETFRTLGWTFGLVKTVKPETLRVHPEGLPVESIQGIVSVATP